MISIASDESLVAVGTRYHGIHLFDKELNRLHFIEHQDLNENVAFSPDSRFLAASFNKEDEVGKRKYGITLWNLSDTSVVSRRDFENKIYGLAWRPDSNYLLAHFSTESRTFLLSRDELATIYKIPHSRRAAHGVDCFADGRTMVGADARGSLFTRPILFEGQTYGGIDYVPHEAKVNRLQYVGQGEVLSVSDDGTAIVSHPGELQRRGVNVLMTVGEEARLAYSAHTSQFFVGDRSGILRDRRERVLHSFGQPINALALVNNDKRVACGLADGSVIVVDPVDGAALEEFRPQEFDPGSRAVNAIEVFGHELFASGGNDYILRSWRSQAEDPLFQFDVGGRITDVAIAEGLGLLFAGGHSNGIAAVDLETGQELFRFKSSRATALVLDRKRLRLVSGHSDSSLVVWDIASRTKLHVLRGHTTRVHSLAISADGDTLASSSADASIRLWNLDRLTEIGIAYQARSGWVVDDRNFGRDERSLYCVLRSQDRNSVVMRLGGQRDPLPRRTIPPRNFDYRDRVVAETIREEGIEGLRCTSQPDRSGAVGVWLDERFKDYEVRATFDLDLLSGSARALFDHYLAKDRDNLAQGEWHGSSAKVTVGKNLAVQTEWVRVTHGNWFAGRDKDGHFYGAILVLDPGSKAIVRSLRLEAREIRRLC